MTFELFLDNLLLDNMPPVETGDITPPINSIYRIDNLKDFENRQIYFSKIKPIYSILYDGCYIAGGCFTSIFTNEKINDVDIFCSNNTSFVNMIKNIMNIGYHPKHPDFYIKNLESTNPSLRALTFIKENEPDIQIIRYRWFASCVDLIDYFDFTCVQFATDGNKIYYNPLGLVDLMNKKLVIHRINHPASTLRRMLKYHNRGFTSCAGNIMRMIDEIKNNSNDLLGLEIDAMYLD